MSCGYAGPNSVLPSNVAPRLLNPIGRVSWFFGNRALRRSQPMAWKQISSMRMTSGDMGECGCKMPMDCEVPWSLWKPPVCLDYMIIFTLPEQNLLQRPQRTSLNLVKLCWVTFSPFYQLTNCLHFKAPDERKPWSSRTWSKEGMFGLAHQEYVRQRNVQRSVCALPACCRTITLQIFIHPGGFPIANFENWKVFCRLFRRWGNTFELVGFHIIKFIDAIPTCDLFEDSK